MKPFYFAIVPNKTFSFNSVFNPDTDVIFAYNIGNEQDDKQFLHSTVEIYKHLNDACDSIKCLTTNDLGYVYFRTKCIA